MGKAYVSRNTGKTVQARELGPGYGIMCRYACKNKLSKEERSTLLKKILEY